MTLLLTMVMQLLLVTAQTHQPEQLRLDRTEYVVLDTATYVSFRLKLINESDSVVVIERADPSCGCVLVTVQRSLATRDQPGDIYVAMTVAKMSLDQPITVDVYTNRNRTAPLRLYLRRASKEAQQQDTIHPTPIPPSSPPATKRKTKRNRTKRR